MNDSCLTVDDPLSPSALERIDVLCERFEDAWQAGQRPPIDDYLSEVEEPERNCLLRELIALDIDYRRQLGEKPEVRDYREYASSLDERWLECLTGASRYELAGEIGRGGMGTVLQGYDRHLRRDLAVKMLRPEHRDQPHMVRRFLREAWIGARLQHPGIVPVYDLGELADRQPYFTMKLVRGHTLATLLKERGNPTAELPRFLTIFEQVCQTMAYAHAQGVLHRDLKPSNIMVGAFGEVQVMDWGLAKVLDWAWGDGAVAGRDAGVSAWTMESTDPGFKTQAGQAMGTYAYMPPEQAQGKVDRVDERSDVFGLGAILCEILIGAPPFRGENTEELFERVKACDHGEAMARLDDFGAEATLLRLAKACLAAEPSDRPRSAGVVAEAVKGYLTEVQELWLKAERERAAAQARAEVTRKTVAAERRSRRRMLRAAFMVLLLGLVVLPVLTWTWLVSPVPPDAPVSPAALGDRQALEKKHAQLRKGEVVTLLGTPGEPVWGRWQLQRTGARTTQDRDKVFRIYAEKGPGMLELLPAAPKRYRLRAQVQHIDGGPPGVVGIYFAHGKRPTNEGTTHCFFRLAFNDRVPQAKRLEADKEVDRENEVRLTLPIYLEEKGGGFVRQVNSFCASAQQFTPAGEVEPMPWRTLEVEVTPERIKTFWGGNLLKSAGGGSEADGVDPNKALELAGRLVPPAESAGPKDRPPEPFLRDAELGLGEGLGLYVDRGAAAFRSVVIEPLSLQ